MNHPTKTTLNPTEPPKEKKVYTEPEIILELDLETRAGSPLAIDPSDPANPLNLLSPKPGK